MYAWSKVQNCDGLFSSYESRVSPKYINGLTLLRVSRNQTKVLYVPSESDSNVVSFTFRIIMFNWVHVGNVLNVYLQECLGLSVQKLLTPIKER